MDKIIKIMIKKWIRQIFALVILYSFFIPFSFSQVSINDDGSEANSSAMLDIKSRDQGLLIPRMTTIERNAIANPSNGLLVFDETSSSFWFYENQLTVWVELISGNSNTGSINDLSDATTSSSSIYTGSYSGQNSSGNLNTSFGINSLFSNLSGESNIAIGYNSI